MEKMIEKRRFRELEVFTSATCRREWAFALMLVLPPVAYYANYCLLIFGLPGLASQLCFGVMAVLAIYAFGSLFLKRADIALALALLFLLIVVSSCAVFGNSAYMFGQPPVSFRSLLLSNIGVCFIECFSLAFLYLGGMSLENSMKNARFLAVVSLVLQLAVFVLSNSLGRYSISADYMSYAYYALVPLIVICFSEKRTIFHKCLIAASACLVFVSGCRGAIVTLGLFATTFLLMRVLGNKTLRKTPAVVAIIVIVLLLFNFGPIMAALSSALSAVGFSSRSIDSLAMGSSSFFSGSGRDVLYATAVNAIDFVGHGIFGDRSLVDGIGSSSLNGAMIAEGAYIHNWILELLLDFGWFFGGIVVLSVLFLCARGFSAAMKSSDSRAALVVSFAIAMILGRYMLSASLFTSREFILSLLLIVWVLELSPKRNSKNNQNAICYYERG